MPTNTEINHCIDEWCHNARHREALKGRMIDGLFNAAMTQMQRQGRLVWDVPLMGRLTFDEQDLRDLHQRITRQGG